MVVVEVNLNTVIQETKVKAKVIAGGFLPTKVIKFQTIERARSKGQTIIAIDTC